MAKKKSARPKRIRIPVYLLPDELKVLSALVAHYSKTARALIGEGVDVAKSNAIKLSMRDAAIFHRLIPRTDVDPIEPAGGA